MKNTTLPTVTVNGKEIPFPLYQIAVHHFNLKLMAKGMTFRGIKLNQIKKYYDLKGKSGEQILASFEEKFKDILNK